MKTWFNMIGWQGEIYAYSAKYNYGVHLIIEFSLYSDTDITLLEVNFLLYLSRCWFWVDIQLWTIGAWCMDAWEKWVAENVLVRNGFEIAFNLF